MGEMVPVLVPAELVDSIHAIVGSVETFQAAASKRTEDFRVSEAELGAHLAKLEGQCQGLMLGALDETAERIQVGGKFYRKMKPAYPQSYTGLRAEVRVERHLYREVGIHNAPTIVPLELRAGIVEGRFTPAAAVGMAHLAQAAPSREADEIARSLGVLPCSRSAHQRGGVAIGVRWASLEADWSSDLIRAEDIPDHAHSITLSVDRVSMPMAEDRPPSAEDVKRGVSRPITVQYRMAYAACWTLCDAQGKALCCVRYAHVPERGAEAMVERLRADLAAVMALRPKLLICTLADGAVDMQNILDLAVAGYETTSQLVDFWHLAEYLGSAIASTGRPVEPELERFKGVLLEWDSGIDVVHTDLATWGLEAEGEVPEAIVKALTYITNRHERLGYAHAHRLGLPIGSGHVEATAKTIFETRMKRTGCRWRPEGGQAIMGLRALSKSSPKRWRAAMNVMLDSYRAEVTPMKARAPQDGISM